MVGRDLRVACTGEVGSTGRVSMVGSVACTGEVGSTANHRNDTRCMRRQIYLIL